jgi:hypothetical protein
MTCVVSKTFSMVLLRRLVRGSVGYISLVRFVGVFYGTACILGGAIQSLSIDTNRRKRLFGPY